MVGTHYTLDRDKKPASPPAEKACRECKVVKANTPTFFGLKFGGTKKREDMVTVDVCKVCHGNKIRDLHKARRLEKENYIKYQEAELVRLIQAGKDLEPKV